MRNSCFTRSRLPLVALASTSLLLAGCETSIDVPEPEHTPRIATSYVLDAGPANDSLGRQLFSDRQPFVSVSQRLFDSRELKGRNDATIEVRDEAGTVVQRYRSARPQSGGTFGTDGYYQPRLSYQFQPGSTYQLRVAVPGIEPAESQLTMPTQVPVATASFTQLSSPDPYGGRKGRLSVSFDDPAGSTDYYLVYARLLDAQGRFLTWAFADDEGDGTVSISAFKLSVPGGYGTYPFSDRGYEGRRLTLTNTVQYYGDGGTGRGPRYIEVVVSHVTRDLYLFYNSRRVYQDNDGNPFSEPTPLHSNIKPGFGIFGGATDAVTRIPL
ncbi:DUF4249 domain-containing protein [Hymenobacter koreensis]